MLHDYLKRYVSTLVHRYRTNDPYELCDYLGIRVWKKPLPASVRGMYIRALRRRYIVINAEIHWQWQRFVCAHELGHDRLHRDIHGCHIDDIDTIRSGKMEFEANTFAAYLLLGKNFENNVPIDVIIHTIYSRNTGFLAHAVRDRTGEYA